MNKREIIAKNVARLFHDGDVVNLGIGIPSLVCSFIPENTEVFIHTENGAVGVDKTGGYPWDDSSRESVVEWMNSCGGERGSWRRIHKDLCNASNEVVSLIPGAACFDSVMSFAIARGGHLDATVLGALQVDRHCNLANWKIPGKKLNGMGGAMDIVSGSKRVIVAMEHCARDGSPKIVEECSLPLTARECVSVVVTELCIIECSPGHLKVTALAPGVSRAQVEAKTAASLEFADELAVMLE